MKPMDTMQKLKTEIVKVLLKETGVAISTDDVRQAADPKFGDLAVVMIPISKVLKENPAAIAQRLAKSISSPYFTSVNAAGIYLNFFINHEKVTAEIIESALAPGETVFTGPSRKVVIEYFSPNTNKPMTVGHLRNLILGSTMARLYERVGWKVIRTTLYNDRGIAISKSMIAYDHFGKGATPASEKMKSDHFVGKYYVMFGEKVIQNPELADEAQNWVRLWEAGDKKIRSLWKIMNAWVYAGYKQTLKRVKEDFFDISYYESKIYSEGKRIAYEALENPNNKLIKRGDEGEIYAELEPLGLPNKVILRSDGTSVYITQDLVLASLKDELKPDLSVYVVADEQNDQMRQLFAILESLGHPAEKFLHLSYGMIRLPDGRIKSREGFGKALADELLDSIAEIAKEEITKRQKDLSKKELAKISEQIMNAAWKFNFLNVTAASGMIFDPAEAVNFQGKTGPYMLYATVRLRSILTGQKIAKKVDYNLLQEPMEKQLVNELANYGHVVSMAATMNDPSVLLHYLFDLARLSHSYYHAVQVRIAPPGVRDARLMLVKAIVAVLTDALGICGIEIPKAM